MVVYQCEDDLENIFTAVYNAYEEKSDPRDTFLDLGQELRLFAEYRPVRTDREKAAKVIRTLRRRFGEEDYQRLCLCLASPHEEKAQAVYQTVVQGLDSACGPGHLFDALGLPFVNLAFSLARGAGNEMHHLLGFLRFQELERGVLYARVEPKNQILVFLMAHFSDRLPKENFVIHDGKRGLFGIHPAGRDWYLFQEEGLGGDPSELRFSEQEACMEELFRHFCHTIAIKERKNLELQRNLLPLRFRENMIEFP